MSISDYIRGAQLTRAAGGNDQMPGTENVGDIEQSHGDTETVLDDMTAYKLRGWRDASGMAPICRFNVPTWRFKARQAPTHWLLSLDHPTSTK